MINWITNPISIIVCTKLQRGSQRKEKTLTKITLKIVQNVKNNSLMNCSGKCSELIDKVHNINNIWTNNSKVK